MQMCSCNEAVEVFCAWFPDSEHTICKSGTGRPSSEHPRQSGSFVSKHVRVSQQQIIIPLYANSAFFSMLFIEGVRTCSIPSLSFAADCSLQCMLFICTAIDKILWIQKKKWTFLCCPTSVGCTVSKTRKKAPFGVWKWKAVVFHTDHFGSIFMLVDSWWNKWWAA